MARSVHLSEEAYALLRSLKGENESFSDVVKRLASGRKDLRLLLRLKGWDPVLDPVSVRERMDAADARRHRELFGESP